MASDPERIDRYEVQALVADGGLGRVYRCLDLPTGETVALKVLPADKLGDRVAVGRFLREARAARDLDHPSIIRIHEVGRWEDTYFLAMEWVDGVDLLDRVQTDGPLPITQVMRVAAQIGGALSHAHAHDVVHRDVKPANIIGGPGDVAKLVDFGFAKHLGPADIESDALSQTGMAMGTPLYIPPEQVRNAKHVGFGSDVYSLGATLYHLLTGRPPFVGTGVGEVLQQVMTATLVPPGELRKDVPAALSVLVTEMMAREPAERIPSMDAMLGRLERISAETTS